MKITENAEEITIAHAPVGQWAAGGLLSLAAIGFGSWLAYRLFIGPRRFDDSIVGRWFEAVPLLVVAAALVWILLQIKLIRAPLTVVRIDRAAATIDVVRRTFYARRARRFHFAQIDKFKSRKSKLVFSPVYFLSLILVNRKAIKLKIPLGADQQQTTKIIKKLNKLVREAKSGEAAAAAGDRAV